MLWRKKRADEGAADSVTVIEAAVLTVPLDPRVFGSKLEQLLSALEDQGGLQTFLDSLDKKHQLFAQVLEKETLPDLDRDVFESMVASVFTARRRLPDALFSIPQVALNTEINALIYGTDALTKRMQHFVDIVPLQEGEGRDITKANLKLQRAAWDLAAEMLHFRVPETYPLMSHWVWDTDTVSGAMREFVTSNDSLRETPFDGRPETFEAVRQWMAEQFGTSGFYRDVHFLIDLAQAWAYTDYMCAMSSTMNLIEADFGGKQDPTEPVQKLLGIGPARRSGQSRLKRATVH